MEESSKQVLPALFLACIKQSLTRVFGEIGGLTTVDLLKFDEKRLRVILRVPIDFYVKLRAALTLISTFDEIPCHFKVNNSSSVLISLIDSFLEI